jgi:membrane protein YqaA with SNARE-associated domain
MEPGKKGFSVHSRCVIMVADGGRADLMEQLLESGELPNIKRHITDRGCYRTALTVFPSTTGPAHIPFVSGIHPGTANVPGYRWLSRDTHDRRRRSFDRHRSLNSPFGLFLGADMDSEKSTSLFEYFKKPSSVLEPVDFCSNRKLSKIVLRRLFYVVRAHKTDDWKPIDRMIEKNIIKRIKSGSECIVGSFFGIDEYSHLYEPFDERTIEAYRTIDRAVGSIAEVLKSEGVYDETILAIVSDHGLSATKVHIPVVDIMKDHGFKPLYYPKLYRRDMDSAVMESGNSMAQIYFKRGSRWGSHWSREEMAADERIEKLVTSLVNTEGMSFAVARSADGGIVFIGKEGELRARPKNGGYVIAVEGNGPLPDHPVGEFGKRELFEKTFDNIYPDAVNQLFLLFSSERSGDLMISSDPSFDLRWQHEDPEHHGSHGSLHREHMHVPLAFSVPIKDKYVCNCDIVPTVLALTGKIPTKPFDGRVLHVDNGYPRQTNPGRSEVAVGDSLPLSSKSNRGWISIAITAAIILMGMIITAVFKDDLFAFGQSLMERHGQGKVDLVLFALTAVSSTPLALPIWGYALVGVAMGYNVVRLALIMALGSATGSSVTFLLGRHFGQSGWVRRKFPRLQEHPWAHGRSRWVVTAFLFLGTASPIPCDVFYAACGLKRYPALLFWVVMVGGRLVRYIYLGYGFDFFQNFL